MSHRYMWEVFVPIKDNEGKQFTKDYHRIWDAKVRKISGGLTLLKVVKGQWESEGGNLIVERVKPVRIACTEEQFKEILELTCKHYDQEMVIGFRFGEVFTHKRGK